MAYQHSIRYRSVLPPVLAMKFAVHVRHVFRGHGLVDATRAPLTSLNATFSDKPKEIYNARPVRGYVVTITARV